MKYFFLPLSFFLFLGSGCNTCNNGLIEPGEICYQEITLSSVGQTPVGIAAGDFDSDSDTDLVTANLGLTLVGPDSLSILLNLDSSQFSAPANLLVGTDPNSVAAVDVNQDAVLDLISSNGVSGEVEVLLADGFGSFESNLIPIGTLAISLQATDLDQDGFPDLLAVSPQNNQVLLFHNLGQGQFTTETPLLTGESPADVVTGDLNNDLLPDLIIANQLSDSVSLFLNEGNFVFSFSAELSVGDGPVHLALGDLNQDLLLDLVVGGLSTEEFQVLLSRGNALFSEPQTVPLLRAGNLVLRDLDQDGDLDLATTNQKFQNEESGQLEVLLNDGTATFSREATFLVGRLPGQIISEDFNSDSVPDMALVNIGSDSVSLLLSSP